MCGHRLVNFLQIFPKIGPKSDVIGVRAKVADADANTDVENTSGILIGGGHEREMRLRKSDSD